MSLLGKILALVNLLGAIGLVYVASVDYGKRQAWTYAYYRHTLILDGLPVDEAEKAEDNIPLVERISKEDRDDLFKSVGGDAQVTQKAEVTRLRTLIDGKLSSVAQSKALQTYHLARILLPLTDSYGEREQLQACRFYLSDDQKAAALKAACKRALDRALEPGFADLPARPFIDAFRAAFREQGNEPADLFLSILLRNMPEDRAQLAKVNFDQAYDAAIEAQRVGLENRYKTYFAEAEGQSPDASQPGKRPSLDLQKAAIARLLFGLCPFLAEDEIFGNAAKAAEKAPLLVPMTQTAYQQGLTATPTYRQLVNRVLVVCGLRWGLIAISENASALRRLGDYAAMALTQEKQQFVYDHAAVIEQIREQASVARAEQSLINENKDRLAGHEAVVNERKKEIATLTEDLKNNRATTMQEAQKLRELSHQVLDLRVKIRDAITANEDGEKRIKQLEKMLRDRENNERD